MLSIIIFIAIEIIIIGGIWYNLIALWKLLDKEDKEAMQQVRFAMFAALMFTIMSVLLTITALGKKMPRLGDRKYWTPEREKALVKLGDAGNLGYGHINWEYAASVLPKERKVLADKTNSQLSKTLLRILKSRAGICQRARCRRKAVKPGRMCQFHREQAVVKATEGKGIYTVGSILRKKKEIASMLRERTQDSLIVFILKNIEYIPLKEREKLIDEKTLKKLMES